jgi:hypothetical protein
VKEWIFHRVMMRVYIPSCASVAPSMTLRSDSKRMMVANARLVLCILAILENQTQSILHAQQILLPHLSSDDSRHFE